MPEEQNPQPSEACPEVKPAVEPVQSGLIDFAEPAGPDALTAQVEAALAEPPPATPPEISPEPSPEPPKNDEPIQSPALNAAAQAEVRHAAHTQAEKDAFAARVLAARTQPPAIPAPQPVAPRILSQTLAEQEAGRKLNVHHANLRANAPQPKREEAVNGSMTPVFRPGNVDEYRNTFRSPAQTVSKDALTQPPR